MLTERLAQSIGTDVWHPICIRTATTRLVNLGPGGWSARQAALRRKPGLIIHRCRERTDAAIAIIKPWSADSAG